MLFFFFVPIMQFQLFNVLNLAGIGTDDYVISVSR